MNDVIYGALFGSRNTLWNTSSIPGIKYTKMHTARTWQSSRRNTYINKWSWCNGLMTTRELSNRRKQVTKTADAQRGTKQDFSGWFEGIQFLSLLSPMVSPFLKRGMHHMFLGCFLFQLEKLSKQLIIGYIRNCISTVIFIPIPTAYC